MDLALEGTARRAVEASLPAVRAAAAAVAGGDGGGVTAGRVVSAGNAVGQPALAAVTAVAALAGEAAMQSAAGDAKLALCVRGLQVSRRLSWCNLPGLSTGPAAAAEPQFSTLRHWTLSTGLCCLKTHLFSHLTAFPPCWGRCPLLGGVVMGHECHFGA